MTIIRHLSLHVWVITAALLAVGAPLLAVDAALDAGSAPEVAAQERSQRGVARGYMTTPSELQAIAQRASQGREPYASAVNDVLRAARREWDYGLDAHESCRNSRNPAWIHNERGVRVTYAKALAYHLTGDETYAEDVRTILERIMTEVLSISTTVQQCRLNFGWGTPELVASADLIEDYWYESTCTGPLATDPRDFTIGEGNCKVLFQNWLVKNPYYVVSYAAENNQSNWGAAATNTLAHIADYLWDRPEVLIAHRYPTELHPPAEDLFTPTQAYHRANQLALDRMNGLRVDYHSSQSCDLFDDRRQSDEGPPVKSQITPDGIIPEDARRSETCNITRYNGDYQNYPQLHLGNNIQQCELMLRRGDSSCYDNIDMSEIRDFVFVDAKTNAHVTDLLPGRGSIERAIDAIIVDSGTEWRHDSALEVAYRYYSVYHRFDGVNEWAKELNRPSECAQDICFGTLTHGFARDETPGLPPMVLPAGPVPPDPAEMLP